MERDERLRSAKEKLKRFQKKRQTDPSQSETTHSSTPDMEDLASYKGDGSSQRSTPAPVPSSNDSAEPSLFTFESVTSTVQFDPFALPPQPPPSMTSSSVSDQITNMLTTQISDVVDNETEVLKARLSQLEKEKLEMSFTIQQQSVSLQKLERHSQEINETLSVVQKELEKERQDKQIEINHQTQTLKTQLDSHAESIQILVAEKAELEKCLGRTKKELADKTEHNVLLKNAKLQLQSDARPSPRERTCACTDRVFLAEIERKRLSDAIGILRDERDHLKIETIDYKQEVMELKSKIDFADKNAMLLNEQLIETLTKLELTEVNLAQLRSTNADKEALQYEENQPDLGRGTILQAAPEMATITTTRNNDLKVKESEIVRLSLENEEHVKRVAELTAYIQQASQDREQIIHQYTSYSQQLATQIETLTQQLNAKASENHNFATREADLVAHVQRLEGQLQGLIQLSPNGQDRRSQERRSPSTEKELDLLRFKSVDLDNKVLELQLERDGLQESLRLETTKVKEVVGKLKERETQMEDLETRLEMSNERSAFADPSQHQGLVAASTSDKVAASRAMKQNHQLKDQVEELEIAVMKVTNSKSQLLTEYDNATAKIRNLEESESTLKTQVDSLQEGVKERDRNMNKMREQMKYYIAFAENSINGHLDSGPREENETNQLQKLIKELQEAQDDIRSLHSNNSELKSQLEVLASRTRDNSTTGCTPEREQGYSNGQGHLDIGTGTSSSSSTGSNDVPIIVGHDTEGQSGNRPHSAQSLTSSEASSSEASAIKNGANNNTFNGDLQVPGLSRDVALLKLEQKFNHAMQRIAELTSEKDNLEHLVTRLTDETDTVGEYITIYQYQRSQQKARLEEKEKQLQNVSQDREELKSKLAQLQALVTQFVSERNTTPESHAQTASAKKEGDHGVDEAEEAGSCKDNNAADKILTLLSEIESNDMLTKTPQLEEFHPWFWETGHGQLMTV